jgi:hypothetical protein
LFIRPTSKTTNTAILILIQMSKKVLTPQNLKKKKKKFCLLQIFLFKTLDPSRRLILFFMTQQPLKSQDLLIIRRFTILFRHYNLYDSSGRVIRPTQTPLPNNTRHSQKADFHAPGEIRNHNTNKQAAANPRLKPCGHRNTRSLMRHNIYQQVASVTYFSP